MSLARLNDPAPHARLLSNGRYSVLITGAGTGYSAWNSYALTGWSADRTEDGDGCFVYLRDVGSGALWSVGDQPVRQAGERYDADYRCGRMRIERLDDGIEARLDLCVAPDGDVEIRRLRLRNRSHRPRRIELTSYAEVVLNHPAVHAAHPAFSKLFVQTEYVPRPGVLLARRRPRGRAAHHPWMLHALIGDGALHHETDRARFIGRGRTPARPLALTSTVPLSGTAGNVLDPIFSLRRVVQLGHGESTHFTLLLGAAQSRDTALQLAARYAQAGSVDAAFAGAGEQERAVLVRLGVAEQRAEYWQELAGAMLYGHPALRATAESIRRARGRLSDLAKYGFGGVGLLAVVHVEGVNELPLVREFLQAQAYWQTKALAVQLLILCAEPASLSEEVRRILGDTGGAVAWRRSEIPPSDLDVIQASAHLVVSGSLPAISGHGETVPQLRPQRPAATTKSAHVPEHRGGRPARLPKHLLFSNGHGGFTPDGCEYVIHLDRDRPPPPLPWVNVVANETFGFLVSESGAGTTWSRNSRENRLTPWYNDPVCDPPGEALYIRDEDAGVFWSPHPGPVPDGARYEVRHGFGYTQWRHSSRELEQDVVQFVPRHDPVKITRLRLTNTSDRVRQLSLVAYHRLVMGGLPSESGRFVVTEFDADSGAILARNHLNDEFSDAVVFAAALVPDGPQPVRYSGDRTAFIGRNGCAGAPAALLDSTELDGRTGAGLDPCAAVQVTVRVAPGRTVECAFLLGETTDDVAAHRLIGRYRRPAAIDNALQEVREFWRQTLSAVHVETPAPAVDLMVNGWLLYQTLSCRLWGRSAFYQSGGAFGFRDQLQDAAALVYTRPDLTRAQIVLHAGHQFVEGDVLHWWHPPASRGIRTRFSDDLLWLPYVTAFYVHTTGDWSVLDAPAGFVTARVLAPGEDEAYLLPTPSGESADVYGHCCRALDRSLTSGAHGLPLMGTGDWNDGMNRVGREGRGESVWVGFFLYRIIDEFVPICERRADHARVQRYRAYQAQLKAALNDAGWDGNWYRRAYYDDGTPLGSAQNDECRIDALVQTWAVLSKAAPPERGAQALDAVEQHLVSKDAGVIRLLTPPFDDDPHDPGYIKGYVPGIRENGGQYTHAAIWVVQALAQLGRRDRAAAYLEMLGPISHSRTTDQVATYQVEPYVVAADICGASPHVGRGGWTWYTGSAGWMYRVALESVLGLHLESGDTLRLKPCVPDTWPQFSVKLRLPDGRTRYEIAVRNPTGTATAVQAVTFNDQPGIVEDGTARIPWVQDGSVHRVCVTLGQA